MPDDPKEVVNRVMRSYMQVQADRALLAKTLEDFERQHNELYSLLITILRQNDNSMRVSKDHWPPFPCGEYLVDWQDAGEEIIVKVRHFSEDD